MAEPPSLGAVQVTLACPTPPVAVPMVGAPGATGCGVTGADAALVLSPPGPCATTLKVTGTPLVSPVTVAEVSTDAALTDATKAAPENASTVNPLTVPPPAPAEKVTRAAPLSGVTPVMLAAAGGASG